MRSLALIVAIFLVFSNKIQAQQAHDCPKGEHWDDSMSMCMPDENPPKDNKGMTMFHYNQFLIATDGSGPRGRSALTAPNMWMLMWNKKTSDNNTVGVDWMGTTDLWTVPQRGTPELLQAGESNRDKVPFIDAQHPHSSPVMGLTFTDILALGANGEHKLTFFFAPRGEATAGPQAFMHRDSAIGNPDAPLSHHLQDVFHIASTVAGIKWEYKKLTLEGSTFSGREPSPSEVNLDMGTPDSYGFRANYQFTDQVLVGGSYAKVKALDRTNNPENETEDERAYAAWLMTNHKIKDGTLSTSSIWGMSDNKTAYRKLNSFLEEFAYQLNQHNFYGRLEVLQRTPEQLQIQVTDGKTGAQWVRSLTLGYERQIEQKGNLKVFAGAAYTKNSLPALFQPAYGGDPKSAKIYLRLNFQNMKMK